MAALTSMVELNLTDNDIRTVAALAPLQSLKTLRDLDMTENDVRDIRGYKKAVLEMLPSLARLDGDGTGTSKAYVRAGTDSTPHPILPMCCIIRVVHNPFSANSC
jgi:hypothetical protein